MKKTKMITRQERSWADARHQSFLGTFVYDPISGLYFAENTPVAERERIGYALLCAPRQLLELARELGLTISTTCYKTLAGHDCSIWGAWGKARDRFSPHVEIGGYSLRGELLVPHLIHELAHLWWWNMDARQRERFVRYLKRACPAAFVENDDFLPSVVEVTEYVHEPYGWWVRSLGYKEDWGENHRRQYLQEWTSESFADSVPAIAVAGYAWTDSTIDLTDRKAAFKRIAQLDITTVSPAAIFALPELRAA
jgi:hypothetical protein